MKKHWKLPAVILIVSCMMLTTSAQETKSDKKAKIEFGIGMNFSGPQQHMVDLMKKYGYDDIPQFWLYGNDSHPHYSNAGTSVYISCCYRIAPRSFLGIRLYYSSFGEVNGYSSAYGRLNVRLSNLSVIPIYTYEFEKILELQVGPGLMINSGNKTFLGIPTDEQYTTYSLGLLTGLNLKIWDRSVTFGKIGTSYLFTAASNMGPYTTSTPHQTSIYTFIVPESKINFSHLNIVFAFGFKL
jgi:hypothetical protein